LAVYLAKRDFVFYIFTVFGFYGEVGGRLCFVFAVFQFVDSDVFYALMFFNAIAR
jgi:hypothetical protein